VCLHGREHEVRPEPRLLLVAAGVREHGAHGAQDDAPAALGGAVALVHVRHRVGALHADRRSPRLDLGVGELAGVVAVPQVDDAGHGRVGQQVRVVAHEGLSRVEDVGMLAPAHEVDRVEAPGAVDEVDRVGEAVVAGGERARDVGVDALAELGVDLAGRRTRRMAAAPASR